MCQVFFSLTQDYIETWCMLVQHILCLDPVRLIALRLHLHYIWYLFSILISYLFGSHTDLNVGQDNSDYLFAQTRIKKRLILVRNHASAVFVNYVA